MMKFNLENFKVQTTGSDGGRKYLISTILHKGIKRRLIVLFKSKKDESKLNSNKITVKGNLIDDGIKQDLMLVESIII